jgi:hypothetical protein
LKNIERIPEKKIKEDDFEVKQFEDYENEHIEPIR